MEWSLQPPNQLSHVRTESIAILLDSVVEVPDQEVAVELRIFLIPDPGSFVNIIDKLDIEEIREKESLSAHDGDRPF